MLNGRPNLGLDIDCLEVKAGHSVEEFDLDFRVVAVIVNRSLGRDVRDCAASFNGYVNRVSKIFGDKVEKSGTLFALFHGYLLGLVALMYNANSNYARII